LIEPCHSNHGEDSCQELLKEISFIVYIIKEKETRNKQLAANNINPSIIEANHDHKARR
jgi:hypothetical protein